MVVFPIVGILLPMVSHVTVVLTLPGMISVCTVAYRGCSPAAKAALRPTFLRGLGFALAAATCWSVAARHCCG